MSQQAPRADEHGTRARWKESKPVETPGTGSTEHRAQRRTLVRVHGRGRRERVQLKLAQFSHSPVIRVPGIYIIKPRKFLSPPRSVPTVPTTVHGIHARPCRFTLVVALCLYPVSSRSPLRTILRGAESFGRYSPSGVYREARKIISGFEINRNRSISSRQRNGFLVPRFRCSFFY